MEDKSSLIQTRSISTDDYARLKVLYKAASRDFSWLAITKVYYKKSMDLFIATDGNVMRVEKIEWGEQGQPETDFYLNESQVILTASQLKKKYLESDFFGSRSRGRDFQVPIRYIPAANSDFGSFPNIEGVIPKLEDRGAHECVGVVPSTLKRFLETFHKEPKFLRLTFGSTKHGGILVHGGDREEYRFLGVIMPARLGSGDLPIRKSEGVEAGAVA